MWRRVVLYCLVIAVGVPSAGALAAGTNLLPNGTFEGSGMPLHEDNQTVIRERIRLDKSDNKLMRLEATITDNSLTRPWSIA